MKMYGSPNVACIKNCLKFKQNLLKNGYFVVFFITFFQPLFVRAFIEAQPKEYKDFNMKTFLLIAILLIFYCGHSVVILQSTTTSTTVVSPVGAVVQYSTYYNSFEYGIVSPGVSWIHSSLSSRTTRYQSLFYTSCIGSANLTITAAYGFYAYLDGVYVGGGFDYSSVFNFPISLSCGNHNLTIYVYSSTYIVEGLTFAINQDQTNCYNCKATGYWNEYTCSCQCITSKCTCSSPKIWKDYPVCGCGCPLIFWPPIFSASDSLKASKVNLTSATDSMKASKTSTSTQALATPSIPIPPPETSIRFFFCLYPRYYSQVTCSCLCHYTYCRPGYYFNDQSCSCLAIIK